MGKFSDVLEKIAERERLEDALEALPSPITIRQQKKDEDSTAVQLGLAPESKPTRADDPNSLLSDETISAETEQHETDEASTSAPLGFASESAEPARADDPNALLSDETTSAETEQHETDEASTSAPLGFASESAEPARADDPNALLSDETTSAETEQHETDEASTSAPLGFASESVEPARADDPNALLSDETISAETEQHETDEASTSAPLGFASESVEPARADDPNALLSDETISAETEQHETDETPISDTSDSEAIRLTQVWPFVAYDPAPAESKKKRKVEAEASSKDESPSVSKIVHSVDPNLVVYHDPASVEAEIFKVLRTNILFPKDGTPPPSVMVTSALPGDGKSFIASNLAVSIAQGIEEYVLLMDCDMRRSTIHKIFGFDDNISGLSEYLSKDVPLTSLLRKTVVKKLTILPGGRTPNNPSELLSSQRMKDLLEEAKKRYKDRFIIVDSPPPHLTAETTALAKYVDGIVLVVRSGRTPKPLVDALIEKIGREKIIGVVLNGHQMPATERYGYGRYNLHNYEYREDKD